MAHVGKFVALTRIGFAARGLIYVLIGYLALRSGRTEGSAGTLEYLNGGAGKALLAVVAAGLLAYAAWRLADALFDTQGRGADAKGVAFRLAGAASGIVHAGLAAVAAKLVAGGSLGGGDGAKQGAAATLALPGGQTLLLIAAAALLAVGGFQLVKAARADFLRHLDPRAARRPWVGWVGRLGYAARGIVFLIVGASLWKAARDDEAGEALGMGQALGSLPDLAQAAIAAGLLLFGIFSLVEGRYREITDPSVIRRLRSAWPAR
ncbi:MAG TPA: DUF1206 domain-containing protein [Allosphingosinicella sp.]|nr:DUF1206 domain-containing protein [Allosphingosinicella sp.]